MSDRATGQTEPRAADSDSGNGPLAILILPFTFAVFCLLFLVTKLTTRRSPKTAEDDIVARIAALPTSIFAGAEEAGARSGATSSDASVCALCLEEYAEGDCLRHLHCGHTFHQRCIDVWLLQKLRMQVRTCPMCKGDPVQPARNTRDGASHVTVQLASLPSAAHGAASPTAS